MSNLIDPQARRAERGAATDTVHSSPGKSTLVQRAAQATAGPVGATGGEPDAVHATAAAGTKGSGGALPFGQRIQSLFGAHDVSDVRAHTDEAATAANARLGSTAYASGDHIAFAGTPDLHTAAHEAAHVVQQRRGVQLKGGVGSVGDPYERHADAVADKVVGGESAEALLSSLAGASASGRTAGAAVQHSAVQFLGGKLGQKAPAGTEAPAFYDHSNQRSYSIYQYIAMWEKEQGRLITPSERETIERGCIGITANNLRGGGRPLDFAEATYADFDQAHHEMKSRNKFLTDLRASAPVLSPLIDLVMPEARYVLFAKRFWSNQSDTETDRAKPDPDAFLADKTGKVDMTDYKYHARTPKLMNFDYGFWDEASESFWHANRLNAAQPMQVLQSTRSAFLRRVDYFDRAVFCIARAKHYDPRLVAAVHIAHS